MGSVDDGTSVSDYDDEEHKHHFSIDTSVLHFEHEGKFVNLLDAPGYPDFVGAALEALNAVETAVIVVSAVNGIEVNTRRMFNEAGKHGLTRLIVINKCDADNVHFPELIASHPGDVRQEVRAVQRPRRPRRRASRASSASSTRPTKTPAGCPVDPQAVRTQLVDAIVECDEAMMEKYLTEGDLSGRGAGGRGRQGASRPAPSSRSSAPRRRRTSASTELLRRPRRRTARRPWHAKVRLGDHAARATTATNTPSTRPTRTGEFLGVRSSRRVNDKFVGNLSFIRVLSGKLDADHPLVNVRTGKTARVVATADDPGQDEPAGPGGVSRATSSPSPRSRTCTSATPWRSAKHAPKLPLPEFPQPMFGLAVEPKNRGDEQKISQSLHKIADEDPTFKITHDPQTHELVINGVSQLHLDVIQHRLKKRFDLEVVTKEPKIPYRETITAHGEADYRHKKQTGGRGQFGEVHMRIYPLPREIKTQQQCRGAVRQQESSSRRCAVGHYDPDYNFAFIDHIVGGTIPNQFMPAVEKGCKELLEHGAIAGYRMQDMAVEVHFGKYHDVDSSEAAFKTAGRHGVQEGVPDGPPGADGADRQAGGDGAVASTPGRSSAT